MLGRRGASLMLGSDEEWCWGMAGLLWCWAVARGGGGVCVIWVYVCVATCLYIRSV